jgi:DNA-binding response OmpR family regulator
LPDGDSLKQIPAVRQRHHGVILMLTALAILDDRVAGLEAGADYYLTKPLRLSELNAVIDSLLYRHQHLQDQVIQDLPQWQLNHQHRKLILPNAVEIALTGQEFLLLAYLMRHVDETINKSALIAALQYPEQGHRPPKKMQGSHTVDLYDSKRIETIIYRIRRKIENQYHGEVPLVNVYGVGYSWRSHAAEQTNPSN